MTRKCVLSLFTLTLLLLSSSALGQVREYPKTEFFGGFSYLNADLITRQNLLGWQVSISDNFHENVGLVVDVGGQYGTVHLSCPAFLLPCPSFDARIQYHDVSLGPRFTVRGERVTWFANATVGIRFANPSESTSDPDVVLDPEAPDEFFLLGFGGGMDVSASDWIGIRVFQFDYRPNRASGIWLHDIRFSSGIVFKWNY